MSTLDRLCAFYVPALFVTVFAKFSIPPFGSKGVALSVGAHLCTAVCRAVGIGDVRFNPTILVLFLSFIAFIVGAPILHGDPFSILSLGLLFTLFVPLTVEFPRIRVSLDESLRLFSILCTFIAIAGVAQYLLQGIAPRSVLFPIETFVPESFRVSAFASDTALSYRSDVYRVNGVFLLEPSFFSQLMALAIVGELCSRNRVPLMLLYLAAMLFSYSGTGILLLAVVLPIVFVRRRRWDFVLYAALLGVLVVLLSGVVHMDAFVARAGSFTSSRSSAFARFVGGFYLLSDLAWPDTYRTLFGFGPGSFSDLALTAHTSAAEMTLFKSLVEYGVAGSILFFAFVFTAVFSNNADLELKIAVLMTLLLNGSYTAFFQPLALALLIWPRGRLPAQPVLRIARRPIAATMTAQGH
jgi:hypothetical protein